MTKAPQFWMGNDEVASEVLRLSGEVAAMRLALLRLLAHQDLGTRRALSAVLHEAAQNASAIGLGHRQEAPDAHQAFGELSRACEELAHLIEQVIQQQH